MARQVHLWMRTQPQKRMQAQILHATDSLAVTLHAETTHAEHCTPRMHRTPRVHCTLYTARCMHCTLCTAGTPQSWVPIHAGNLTLRWASRRCTMCTARRERCTHKHAEQTLQTQT